MTFADRHADQARPEERRVSQMLARGRQQFDEVCMLDMLNPVEALACPEGCAEYEPFAA
ncbi:hypothetical protein M2324_003592 [Rhodovulum sulfidophilum]|uniref:hypothetical protein n=1 Tax=Rhodovulum sulfidophilum TaxID=35806 RepID=UPI0012DA1A9F|nr:hypothetical protein [Rhodovulum sulfidophilum]MCW2305176.1 hypothetical protein [Rhodovulum sulfidophilum]